MLRLQCSILTHILSSLSASPFPPLRRLISAAASAISPSPSFVVEEYLVDTCGLTRTQALKVSPKLSHLKSPSKPDAVLAFLAGLGLSSADVASVVAKDPKLLCTGVERTLFPVVSGLANLGLARPEIALFVSLGYVHSRCRSVFPKLEYYLHLFGSFPDLLPALRRNSYLLCADIERVVKPIVVLLRECGLDDRDIAKLCISKPRLLTTNQERVRAMVACAEGLGVPRGSGMFRHALNVVGFSREEKITAKVDSLKNTFRWSDAEVGIVVSKAPTVLARANDLLQRKSKFLISEVGLEPAYLARRSALLTYSLDGRLRPRYYAMKFLKENGFLGDDRDYYGAVVLREKVFVEKYICPHKEAAPQLTEDYAPACKGEVPTRFKFT